MTVDRVHIGYRTLAEDYHACVSYIQDACEGESLKLRFDSPILSNLSHAVELAITGHLLSLGANWLAISVFDSYDAILGACCTAWNRFANDPKTVTSITERSWAKARLKGRWYDEALRKQAVARPRPDLADSDAPTETPRRKYDPPTAPIARRRAGRAPQGSAGSTSPVRCARSASAARAAGVQSAARAA